MLAVKAEYNNGTVRWLQAAPPLDGSHHVTVIFDEDIAPLASKINEAKRRVLNDVFTNVQGKLPEGFRMNRDELHERTGLR